ncbi:MAG: hypothetical protein J1F32_06475 [Erysipelotrichales bacterium]|nr:hypothetical protein [Erysipelotrichales bacterium]
MKGKSYSIPQGMVFKKYYCSKCGTRLVKERTHRIVRKYDKDYFQYQRYNYFPRYDYDVYDNRFKCPSCNTRIAFVEQCRIERIPKKYKKKILSSEEIKNNYKEATRGDNRRVLIRNISVPVVFNIILFTYIFFFVTGKTIRDLFIVIILFLIDTLIIVILKIKDYKGSFKLRINQGYSHEKEAQLEKLHAYSSNNKELIDRSNKCYCFHCKSELDSKDVHDYIDEGKTALCPKCGIDSIIPDSIDEEINEIIIVEMNNYWF